ncbi:MAG: hypothetical protein IAF02_08760 [Anaerolineae bacterium]|nr:hypothetical protein [Anaerolineae bacterium]
MTTIDPSTIGEMLRESLAKGHNPRLTVTSNSMAPLFWANDQVILTAVQPEQLNPGDIITIINLDTGVPSLLTHRIWARQENGFITRGDHALVFDAPCPPEAILGRVIGRSHKGNLLVFQDGLGQWLDQHVAALARREQRWLTGSQEAPKGDEPVITHTKRSGTRFVHRLFFGWAICITFIVNLATRIKSGETKI